ncbi:unnamed protein product [Microthlaspi erraticum]|uniref:DUF659 domain-containing protein n=1 Tax=Microthlaspi erraticum TaxID=1685480 RepID=A0A6D2J1P3_9BRAS|nr:unnamed protein product [Microthlaspi erraticum]
MEVPPTEEGPPPSMKRNSNDIGWDYGRIMDLSHPDRLKCILCGKEVPGGVFRMKEHIAQVKGNMASCPHASKEDQDKCMKVIVEARRKKAEKRKAEEALRAEVNLSKDNNVDELERELGTLKSPHFHGPMDRFTKPINPEVSMAEQKRQQGIHDAISKERSHAVHQYCALWMYSSGIAFNAIDNEDFRLFCEALGQFGAGWKPPSQYQLRGPLLVEEQQKTKEKMKTLEEEWVKDGCSVMTDAWTDMNRRSIMNLCVNSKGGTCFLSSKDSSKDGHTGQYIFEYIDKCIEEVGADKVVQVVTDNATNNVAAAKLLKEKRPSILWSGCAAHTLDLMLEGISKLHGFVKLIDQVKALTIFIYGHHQTLDLMRSHTKNKDIVRPGATRFATCYLTVSSLYEKKAELKNMFSSEEWHICKHSKTVKGQACYDTVKNIGFLSSMMVVLKVFSPLVKVLRLADGERIPSLGFIYGEILEAKKSIKEATDHSERGYEPILKIVDEKMKEIFYHGDLEKQDIVVNHEVDLHKNKSGSFGWPLARKGCEKKDDKFDPAPLVVKEIGAPLERFTRRKGID